MDFKENVLVIGKSHFSDVLHITLFSGLYITHVIDTTSIISLLYSMSKTLRGVEFIIKCLIRDIALEAVCCTSRHNRECLHTVKFLSIQAKL